MNKEKDILNYLNEIIPNPVCELNYNKDYELLLAVMLSAQTKDARVNKVTKVLFDKYDSLKKLKEANIKDIEKYGFSTDLKLNYNKYDIVLQSKNKKLIIPVNQFKNKDILRLLELIEDKTNIKPTGLAKYLRETKK